MNYELHHGDCLEVMRIIPDASVDCVLTDPPYNVKYQYEGCSDDMLPLEYEAWRTEWFQECRRIARQTVVFCGHGNLGMWHRIAKPSGVGCWFKPGNPARGGVFQFCEWEPFLLYGGTMSKSDVIRAPVSKQKDVGSHPCPKPLGLMVEVLRRLKKVESVLDPFMGSGTTGVACELEGRKFIGIEKDDEYFRIAKERIEGVRKREPLFMEQAA